MKYRITSTPTHCGGEPFDEPGDPWVGAVVTVTKPEPDGDGDVYIEELGGRNHIAFACLTPLVEVVSGEVIQISAVRAALVALGIEADVVAVAQAIEAAAKGAER